MKVLKRLAYFLYYLRELDWEKFRSFKAFVQKELPTNSWVLWWRIFSDSISYNIGILEYFQFGFYKLDPEKKATYAGTGYMYEYQRQMNPSPFREVLANKIEFLKTFSSFVHREFATIQDLKNEPHRYASVLNPSTGKLVLKGSRGQVGAEVQVMETNHFADVPSLVRYMEQESFDLVEEYVVQHPDLMQLSPSGLNTVRVITQHDGKNVVIIGARLRITINSAVDNLAAGNAAAPVDLDTGIVSGEAVFSDITRSAVAEHPVTKVIIPGFRIPWWQETKAMVLQAAQQVPQNKSVGWDVAITEKGPLLIEGNHNWCKLLWQLPAGRGLKHELEQYT